MKKLLSITILAVSICSCSDEGNSFFTDGLGLNEKTLNISTEMRLSHPTQEFTNSSMLGLYIMSGHKHTDYKNVKTIAIYENNRLSWKQEPAVFLDSEAVTLYAYYPYQPEENLCMTRIPVKICPDARLTDNYMYGTHAPGQKTINNISPIALLKMNHALSSVSFEIKLNKKTDCFLLTAVQLGNKPGGSEWISEGCMDITTGIISRTTGVNAPTKLTLECPVELTTSLCNPIRLKVIPTPHQVREGSIEALFFINGKLYKFPLPAVKWEKGHEYQYQLTFTGNSLTLDKVQCKNLDTLFRS